MGSFDNIGSMPKKPFEPNFQTPKDQLSKEEINKLNSNGLVGHLKQDFADHSKPDIAWESEQIAKSHGIYLEFNRAKTGSEKDWRYMIRIGNPGGGPINREQWLPFEELSEKYTTTDSTNTSFADILCVTLPTKSQSIILVMMLNQFSQHTDGCRGSRCSRQAHSN